MSKTTSVATFYTSNVIANGTTVSGDEVYAPNDIIVYRIKVNGTDVIHKFTRTVVRAYSNLTFTITFRFSYYASTSCSFTDWDFASPIYLDVKVSGSGFTSITGVTVSTRFYCQQGDHKSSYPVEYWYDSVLTNQSFTIGQQKTLTFSFYNGKGIEYEKEPRTQPLRFNVYFAFTDPDGVNLGASPDITKSVSLYIHDGTYSTSLSGTRVVNGQVLSDTTVQEY